MGEIESDAENHRITSRQEPGAKAKGSFNLNQTSNRQEDSGGPGRRNDQWPHPAEKLGNGQSLSFTSGDMGQVFDVLNL